ncbi:serpin A3-7-like [Condylostylus longicornis]|uniref:serpin A3-7-like n=1 Tax=Condylostylus longicornis TaxID=2530218 RepID=UPI00244E30DA|nr:serpin A3-7-like [Condylostylus longicornis]
MVSYPRRPKCSYPAPRFSAAPWTLVKTGATLLSFTHVQGSLTLDTLGDAEPKDLLGMSFDTSESCHSQSHSRRHSRNHFSSAKRSLEPSIEAHASFLEKTATFSMNLFKRMMEPAMLKEENVVVAPNLIRSGMCAVSLGSAGKTKEELMEALEGKGSPYHVKFCQQMNDQFKASLASITSDVFVAEGCALSKKFKKKALNFYDTAVQHLKAKPEDSVKFINDCLKKKTNGKIDILLTEDDIGDSTCVLTSSAHFEAEWKTKFEKERTIEFEGVEMPFLYQKAMTVQSIVWEPAKSRAVRLPLKNDMYLVILTPPNLNRMKKVVKCLGLHLWRNLIYHLGKADDTTAQISLPKFTLEHQFKAKDNVKEMGIRSAFLPGAKLGIVKEGKKPYISDVIQKARFSVDEGEELPKYENSDNDKHTPSFTFNKPFLFFVTQHKFEDRPTREIGSMVGNVHTHTEAGSNPVRTSWSPIQEDLSVRIQRHVSLPLHGLL